MLAAQRTRILISLACRALPANRTTRALWRCTPTPLCPPPSPLSCPTPPTRPPPATPGPQPWRGKSLALVKQAEAQRHADVAAAQAAAHQLLRFIGLADCLVLGQLAELARLAVLLCVRQLEAPRKGGLFVVAGALDDGPRGLPAWGRSPTLLRPSATMLRPSGVPPQAAAELASGDNSTPRGPALSVSAATLPAAAPPSVFSFSPRPEDLASAVANLPREILHVVMLSASGLSTYPEVRQLMVEVGQAAGVPPWLLPAAPNTRTYEAFGGSTRVSGSFHGEVLKGAVDVPNTMVGVRGAGQGLWVGKGKGGRWRLNNLVESGPGGGGRGRMYKCSLQIILLSCLCFHLQWPCIVLCRRLPMEGEPVHASQCSTPAIRDPAQARLQQAVLSDYQAAMAHAAMQPFIGHELQWAMVSSFSADSYG